MAKGFSVYVEIAGGIGSSFTAAVDAAESRIRKLSSVVKAPTMIAPSGFAGSLLTAETKLKSLAEAAGKSAIDARKHFDGLAESVKGVVGILVAHNAAHLAFRAGERYREYDKERRYGKAVMGITDEQQEPLVRQAIKGGATSKYNDIQWLEAQRELAARGLNVNQVLALTGVSSTIGQAMDRSLPEASKALEGGMFGFGKDTSTYESALANAKRTADLQVKASKISGMSYDDILESYKFAATPFKLAGLSEEQMLAFAGVGKKANMPGAEMGTAGRALVANLLKPTAGARTAMMANGIDFSKYQTQGAKPMDAESFSKSIAASYGVELDKGTKQALQKTFNDKSIVGDSAKFMPAIMSVLSDHLGGDDAKSKKSIAGEARRYRDASMSGVDAPRLFNDLMSAMAKNPTLANAIFGAKQGGRIMSALGDPGIFQQKLDELQNHSQGYAQSVSDARMAGFDGALSMLSGSIANFDTALGRAFDNDGKGGFLTTATLAIKRLVDVLVDANPAVLRFGALLAGAVATSAVVRFANTVFGFTSMARSISYLSMSATYGLAARLIGISRAIVTFTAASSAATAVRSLAGATAALALAAPAALATRLRSTAAGVMALYGAGGARGVLVALAGSIAGVGRSILLFPLLQLRSFGAALVAMPLVRLRATVAGIMALQAVGGTGAVFSALAASLASFAKAPFLFIASGLRLVGLSMWSLVANPVGIVLAGIVTGLAALGLWIANNWSGIVSFFGAFGSAFMGALGPGASGAIEKVVGWLGTAWRWIYNLLGPIDATGERWKAWGASAGTAAAAVVNGLLALPTEIAKIAKAMWDSLVNFDWVAAGASIAGAVGRGLGGLAMAPVDWLKGKFGLGQAAPLAAPVAPAASPALAVAAPAAASAVPAIIGAPKGVPLAGARAIGGPVERGLPYLVGERGPEIFVPETGGRIETNSVLNSVAKAGGSTKSGSALAIGVDASAIEEAGRKAQRAGEIVHTSLDVAVMPLIFTGSLDEATRRAEKLRAIIAATRYSPIALGDWSGGDVGEGEGGGRRGFMAHGGQFGGGAIGGIGQGGERATGTARVPRGAIASGVAGAGGRFGFMRRGREGVAPDGSPMPESAGGGKTDPTSFKGLLFRGESSGDPGIYNYKSGGRYKAGHFNADQMTIGDLMAKQRAGSIFAAGKYQMIPGTLAEGVKALGLKPGDKFDSATQDRLFTDYLAGSKRPAISSFITGKGNLIAAERAASREWASVGDPDKQGTVSHYGSDHASISPQQMGAALEKARAQYETLIKQPGMTPETARRSALLGIGDPKTMATAGMAAEPARAAASAGRLVADDGRGVVMANGESGGHMRGKLALDGKAYDFGSGGNRGANSIPFGDYEITPDAVGAWGKANGALGIANGHIYDKTLGRMREGIELHAAHSANMLSSGCLAFAKGQFDDVKSHVLKMVREKGHAYLHVGSNGASITPTKAPPNAMAATPEKKDAAPKTAMAEPVPAAVKVASASVVPNAVPRTAMVVPEKPSSGPAAAVKVAGASATVAPNAMPRTAMATPQKPPVDAVAPVKLAGARAMGGPVGAGLSYLVGERGPEIFSPGAAGQISTNGTLSRLTDIGRRVIEGSGQKIAPQAEQVAKARPEAAGSASAKGGGGDRSFHAGEHHWNIKANDPKGVREEVDRAMMGIIAQFESMQRGSLSD